MLMGGKVMVRIWVIFNKNSIKSSKFNTPHDPYTLTFTHGAMERGKTPFFREYIAKVPWILAQRKRKLPMTEKSKIATSGAREDIFYYHMSEEDSCIRMFFTASEFWLAGAKGGAKVFAQSRS